MFGPVEGAAVAGGAGRRDADDAEEHEVEEVYMIDSDRDVISIASEPVLHIDSGDEFLHDQLRPRWIGRGRSIDIYR